MKKAIAGLVVGLLLGACAGEGVAPGKKLKAYSFYWVTEIAEDGTLVVPDVDAPAPYVVFAVDKDDTALLAGYVFPGDKVVKLDAETTALALVLLNPVLSMFSPESRNYLPEFIMSDPNFSRLVVLVEDSIKKGEGIFQPISLGLASHIASNVHEKIFDHNPEKFLQDVLRGAGYTLGPEGLDDWLNAAWQVIKSAVKSVLNKLLDILKKIARALCYPEGEPYLEPGKIHNPRHIHYGVDLCKRINQEDKVIYHCNENAWIAEGKWSTFHINAFAIVKAIENKDWSELGNILQCNEDTETQIDMPSDGIWRYITYKGFQANLAFLPRQIPCNYEPGESCDCLFMMCGQALGIGDGSVLGSRAPRLAFLANTFKILKIILRLAAWDPLPDGPTLAYAVEAFISGGDFQYLQRAIHATSISDIVGLFITYLRQYKDKIGELIAKHCSICDQVGTSGVLGQIGQVLGKLSIIGTIYNALTAYIPFVLDLIGAPAHNIMFARNGLPVSGGGGAPFPEVIYTKPQELRPGLVIYIGGAFPLNGSIIYDFGNGKIFEGYIAKWHLGVGEVAVWTPTEQMLKENEIKLPTTVKIQIINNDNNEKSGKLPVLMRNWAGKGSGKGHAVTPGEEGAGCNISGTNPVFIPAIIVLVAILIRRRIKLN